MAKVNGSLNGWPKLILVALLAGGAAGPGGAALFGDKPHNPGPNVVTAEQWTSLNREMASLTTEVRGMKTTLDVLAARIPKP